MHVSHDEPKACEPVPPLPLDFRQRAAQDVMPHGDGFGLNGGQAGASKDEEEKKGVVKPGDVYVKMLNKFWWKEEDLKISQAELN